MIAQSRSPYGNTGRTRGGYAEPLGVSRTAKGATGPNIETAGEKSAKTTASLRLPARHDGEKGPRIFRRGLSRSVLAAKIAKRGGASGSQITVAKSRTTFSSVRGVGRGLNTASVRGAYFDILTRSLDSTRMRARHAPFWGEYLCNSAMTQRSAP